MDKHVLVMIPGGEVVAVADAVPDRGQIEVRWNSQIVTVFVEDLLERSEEIPLKDARSMETADANSGRRAS
ncbi:MAG: hypothetical protein ACK5AZ_18290 [Bryobacteraceae bacterium]